MESLVLFTKAPARGRVKTRLANARGETDAVKLYNGFLGDTVDTATEWKNASVPSDPNRRLVIACDPDINDPIYAELARRSGGKLIAQEGDGLGARLQHMFDEEFARGARAVCAIGTDSPTLPAYLLDDAFRALLFERVALGPTFDGGYWLVGAQRPAPDLFNDIPWSTAAVLATTLQRLAREDVGAHLLPFWYDVDVAEDLERLVWHAREIRGRMPTALAHTWQALIDIGLIRE